MVVGFFGRSSSKCLGRELEKVALRKALQFSSPLPMGNHGLRNGDFCVVRWPFYNPFVGFSIARKGASMISFPAAVPISKSPLPSSRQLQNRAVI